MFSIASLQIASPSLLAPMAGVSDAPFRRLCREFGAGLACGEMLTSDASLWQSRKSSQRLKFASDLSPRAIQIVGNQPLQMADAARCAEDLGAELIDINMGCPAKKVCNKAAGSALLRDETLVRDILKEVRAAVQVPVTLKIRTGWDPANRNALQIARLAEAEGMDALTIHGRTRACRFKGQAEYDTIAKVAAELNIPVIANGDICDGQQARKVLQQTGAAAVMIGRAAQGQPWLFKQINHFITHGEWLAEPSLEERGAVLLRHLRALHEFYGAFLGLRIARKHVSWYLQAAGQPETFRRVFNQLEDTEAQLDAVQQFFQSDSIKEVAVQ